MDLRDLDGTPVAGVSFTDVGDGDGSFLRGVEGTERYDTGIRSLNSSGVGLFRAQQEQQRRLMNDEELYGYRSVADYDNRASGNHSGIDSFGFTQMGSGDLNVGMGDRGMDVSNSTSTGVRPEEIMFARVLQELDSSDIFEVVQSYEHVLEEVLKQLSSSSSVVSGSARGVTAFSMVQGRGGVGAAGYDEMRMKEILSEKRIWQLLGILYNERLCQQSSDDDFNGDMALSLREDWDDRNVIDALYKKDSVIRQCQHVVEWLEKVCKENLESSNMAMQNVLYYADNVYWENTLYRLKQGKLRGGLVGKMDPDAPERFNGVLDENDAEDETRLLRTIFYLVRSGQQDRAEKVCRQCGQAWRAASLLGWKPRFDPNTNGNTGDMVCGNPYRQVWKQTCLDMAENGSFNMYEKAVYGALSGHIQHVLPVCETWHDYLWAFYKCAVESRIDGELELYQRRGPSDVIPSEHVSAGEQSLELDPYSIFTDLDANSSSDIKKQSFEPHHLIVKMIILDEPCQLVGVVYEWVSGCSKDFNGNQDSAYTEQFARQYPHLLRFVVHLIIFFRNLNYDLDEQLSNYIIEAYVRHLIQTKQRGAVALYTSALAEETQVLIYAGFLEELSGTEERQHYLQLAENAGLDLQAITKRVVENIRHSGEGSSGLHEAYGMVGSTPEVSVGDKRKIEAIEWLCFDDSQRCEALLQFNAVMRSFLAAKKISAASELLSKLPSDTVSAIRNLWTSDEAHSVPVTFENAIREYLGAKAYLNAFETYKNWQEYHYQRKPKGVGSNNSDSMSQWKAIEEMKSSAAIESLYSVLLFPEGWMCDASQVNEWENEEGEIRYRQMQLLKRDCIPSTTFLLHKVLCDTEQFEKCWGLADLIADDHYRLHENFSSEELQSFLQMVRTTVIRHSEIDRTSFFFGEQQ
eukprot:Nk52_evm1s1178 gene=Nk52_evmTU1s1178